MNSNEYSKAYVNAKSCYCKNNGKNSIFYPIVAPIVVDTVPLPFALFHDMPPYKIPNAADYIRVGPGYIQKEDLNCWGNKYKC